MPCAQLLNHFLQFTPIISCFQLLMPFFTKSGRLDHAPHPHLPGNKILSQAREDGPKQAAPQQIFPHQNEGISTPSYPSHSVAALKPSSLFYPRPPTLTTHIYPTESLSTAPNFHFLPESKPFCPSMRCASNLSMCLNNHYDSLYSPTRFLILLFYAPLYS